MLFSFKQILEQVEPSVRNLALPDEPRGLYEPIEYVLSLGGKRLRPALLLMAANLYKTQLSKCHPAAVAFEVFHNFTLLHDDLMDKADQRRGKPAVHKRWDDNTAILSGDVMLVVAYKELAKVDSRYLPALLDLFSTTAAEVCEGQQYDMEFETRDDVREEEYLEMIRLKTAVLLAACLKAGAFLGDATASDAQLLYDFGINIGLAFQLKDDLLDVYGDSKTFGKKIGGDILCNKKTFMLINALKMASDSDRKELDHWLLATEFDPQTKIAAVTRIYDRVGVKGVCEAKMEYYYEKALNALDQMKIESEKNAELKAVAALLMSRES